ncbi:MAG TPA: hypothetical protein DEX33_00035 [Cellvibrionales bacterium]|nr:hypothetical protein [Cellvibrionales bacterium]
MLSSAVSINAAQVNFTSGTSSTPSMNQVNAFEFDSAEYNQHVTDFALVSPDANNGEELIYLGAYQNVGYDSESDVNTIAVDLQNLNTDQAVTAGVSLVLSGGRKMTWDLTWDTSVALNSIVLFGLKDQSLIINGTAVDLSDMSSSVLGLDIKHSETSVCGYALPQDTMDCRTDRLLGINRNTTTLWGQVTSSNGAGVNYLSDSAGLKITSFNGAYEANDFVIGIETTAVPLPGALLFFSSSLCLVFLRLKTGSNRL